MACSLAKVKEEGCSHFPEFGNFTFGDENPHNPPASIDTGLSNLKKNLPSSSQSLCTYHDGVNKGDNVDGPDWAEAGEGSNEYVVSGFLPSLATC